jgi:hypothetical protein
MSFESKIITNSEIKQNKLLRAATIASERPDTGVVIKNKSAYFVIRDCADITQKYLALLCYGSYTDPLKQLNSKFTKIEVIDFVARARVPDNSHVRQLLCAIFADINRDQLLPTVQAKAATEKEVIVVTDLNEDDLDDIYGDYDYVDAPVEKLEEPTWLGVDTSDDSVLADMLIKIFNAK